MFAADAVARIDRSAFFLELYGKAPEFVGVELMEFIVKRDGPVVRIRFSPRGPPRVIPKKWKLESVNAASIELDFVEIRELSLTKFETRSICDLDLLWRDRSFHLEISGDAVARVVAGYCFVQKISGYQRSLAEE
jgi:hypothetical protein